MLFKYIILLGNSIMLKNLDNIFGNAINTKLNKVF